MKKVLILIDMQKGFKPSKNLIDRIVEHVNNNEYDIIIATKFINKKDSNFMKALNYDGMFNEQETDLVDEIKSISDIILIKNTYSAYTEELKWILQEPSYDLSVDVCGVDSDACVLATAFSLFDAGYSFRVLEDLIESSGGDEFDQSAKRIIKRNIEKVYYK